MNDSAPTVDRPCDQLVSCDCPPRLHLRVGLAAPSANPVHACVGCGRLSFTEVLWRHVHHNTYDADGLRERPLPQDAAHWLDQWPRMAPSGTTDDPVFLPARVRCDSVAALTEAVAASAAVQAGLSRGARARAAGLPLDPAPACLPLDLQDYRDAWTAAHYTPATDPAQLWHAANPQYGATSDFALDCLLRRPDLPALLLARAATVGSDRSTLFALLRGNPVLLSVALPPLLAWIELHADPVGSESDRAALPDLLDFLARQQSEQARLVPALEAIKSHLGRKDFELSRRFTEAIRALKNEPPLPVSTTPWFFNS